MKRKFVDEVAALELLRQLVGIESVNPVFGGSGEAAVCEFVSGWLRDRKIAYELQEVFPGRCNVLARVGPEDKPTLLIEAHMDTVGVEGWATGSPFELKQVGQRYFGRGSCDTKASLATFMLVLERFAASPEDLRYGLAFAATVDEESEQAGAGELAKKKDELGLCMAITGEPTCSDLIARHKGVGRYLLSTSGRAAHASTPELGENAIYKAARICLRLEALEAELKERPREREIERGTVNVGVVRGGIGFNVVPDSCRIDVDRRLGTKEDPQDARSELEAICFEEGAGFEVFLERPPLRGEESGAFVQGLRSAAAQAGYEVEQREVPYMTNAVSYEAAGIPSIVFGPGDIAQAHKNDEYIEAGQMLRSLQILETFLSGT
ncbi:ArgE/DapE family deacylase [Pelagicoccus sp. NFK12]|uniref:Probable succinyl-diaminopimelate desuccinylase n=1 Tax=Pelagicoccus enzymogenes TaxID=2773457 RepID=A0A927IHF6_9BACT|nr:ArgE/DapE family deacylase [Pelagicoccus enzymogenes]MBD5779400.1 ArgE/DapE family deacylase [Pelagicoccus enzymogenes]